MNELQQAPDIKIAYCTECRYGFLAEALAKQIRERFDLAVTLEPSHGGIYAIRMNDEVIYNNLDHGGMLPDVLEILATLESRLNPSISVRKIQKLKVYNPMGFPPAIESVKMAPRLDNLDGKLIYLVDARFNDGDRFLLQMQRWFKENLPQTRTKFVQKAGVYTEEDTALFEEIKQQGHAMVLAVGH
jgi:selT/selW/selH-like putative selenoprotein